MKHHVVIFLAFLSSNCIAQKYIRPVFDRTDTYTFHLDSVEVTKDSTYLFFTYNAEDHSWVCISDSTYLEDVYSGEKYRILDVEGIPFSPEKKHFIDSTTINVALIFPHIRSVKFNLIEDEDDKAFNIYGINIKSTFATSYTSKDIDTFFNLATKEDKTGNWQSAINYAYKQLEAAKFVEGMKSQPSACAMYNLTLYYCSAKEYEKAIEWGNEAINILQTLPQDSLTLDVLARSYGTVSTAYYFNGQHEQYSLYKEKSLTIRRLGYGVSNYSYDYYLSTMAYDYFAEQNYPKALLYEKEYVDLLEKKYKEDSIRWGCDYISALSQMSEFYIKENRGDKAIECLLKALKSFGNGTCEDREIFENILINEARVMSIEREQIDFAINTLDNIIQNSDSKRNIVASEMILADIYIREKQDTIYAINKLETVLKIIEESRAREDGVQMYNQEFSDVLNKLFDANKERCPALAQKYLKKAIKHQKEWTGEESIAYGNLLLKYIFYFELSNWEKERDSLLYNLRISTEIVKRHINNIAYNLTQYDRAIYWQRYEDVFTWFIPTMCGLIRTNNWNGLAYDTALFYKGLLLSSENKFRKVISSSNDSTLNNLFDKYIRNLYLLENKHAQINKDSLLSLITKQEFSLSQIVTRLSPQNKNTFISWKDVKKCLKEEDVAIEIVSYSSIDESDIYYDAYLIDNKSEAPLLIPMIGESQIKKCINKDIIDYAGLSSIIWGNKYLNEALKDKKNIYFSASGVLNTIGIEYLPIANGLFIFDKYNIYRVSSTRELCYNHSLLKSKNVCLFGGLDYEYAMHRSIDDNIQTMHVSRAIVDSIARRGGFDPLYGSKQEVIEIEDEMTRNNITCSVYSNSLGTEQSFKKLSGSQIDIIHLSTHGMYIPIEKTLDGQQNFRFIISNEDSNIDEESAALSRSFLVMSGGNMLIRNDSITNSEEDGILTALEISHLDFSNLDLVVISACQTALGDIDSDGVYGLQRAFKKTGANTILMSLDKVNDEATRILMVEFYKNLISGKSKLESLKDAQKILRQVDNGKYDDPKYWAPFIMLDGLD